MRQYDMSDLPPYIFELAEFDDSFSKVFGVIGFVPDLELSRRAEAALYGIAVRRGKQPFDWPVTPDVALRALLEEPDVEARFRQQFVFVQW